MRFKRIFFVFFLLAAVGLAVALATTAYSGSTSSFECGPHCYEVAQPQPLPPALEGGKVVVIHGYRMSVPRHVEAIGVLNDSLFIRYDANSVVAVTLDTLESAAHQLEYLRDSGLTFVDWANILYTATPDDFNGAYEVGSEAYSSIMAAKTTYFGEGLVARYDGEDLSIYRVSDNPRLPSEEEVTVVDATRPNQLLYVSATGLDADVLLGIIGSIEKE